MMSPEDESVLSAYIDGELDPRERLAVESALAEDAGLLSKVRGLVAVRDLVADLPRTAAPDVSQAVLQRIQHRQARSRPWKSSVRRNLPWLATGLASAAAVALVMIGLFHQRGRAVPEKELAGQVADKGLPAAQPETPIASQAGTVAVANAEGSGPEPRSPEADSGTSAGTALPEQGLALRSTNPSEMGDRARLRSLMDDPRLRRIFLVTDQMGGSASEQVASLVERSTRRDYFKITVSQGIVIDPDHPGRAVVFAVVLDETELGPFRKSLKDRFKDQVQDREVDPAVAMQLADVGEFVSLPARPEARITIPREKVALLTNGPTLAQMRSAPVPDLPEPQPEDTPAVEPAGDSPLVAGRAGEAAASRAVGRGGGPAGAMAAPGEESASSRTTAARRDPIRSDDHHLVVLVWVSGPGKGS